MLKRIIGQEAGGSTGISFKLQQVTFNSIRKVLPDSAIERACEDAGHVYRKRMLTPVVTVLHMILAALWPEESFQGNKGSGTFFLGGRISPPFRAGQYGQSNSRDVDFRTGRDYFETLRPHTGRGNARAK